MKRKITPKQIEEMKKLREEGMLLKDIGKIYKINQTSVRYHVVPGVKERTTKRVIDRFRSLPKEERQKSYKMRREYMKNYMHKRYHEDEEFRERIKGHAKRWKNK